MNAELDAHESELNALREDAARLLKSVGDGTAALHWRPDEATWSVAQQFDHLAKVGGLVLPPLRAALGDLAARNARAPGPSRYPFIERLFVRLMNPTGLLRLIPVPVPAVYEPSKQSDATAAEVAAAFDALQVALLDCVEAAHGWDLAAARFASPANAAVRLSAGAWLAALIAHERYHIARAQKLRGRRDFPDLT